MRDLGGGCFGKPNIGMLYGVVCILLLRMLKRGGQEFLETIGHLERIKEWLSLQMGSVLANQIFSILYLPLSSNAKDRIGDPMIEIHDSIYLTLGLLSNIILEDSKFANQFTEFGGLEPNTALLK
ncbi:hypothetical protein ACTFIY_009861 [Dictyostelium cf. discoideum]